MVGHPRRHCPAHSVADNRGEYESSRGECLPSFIVYTRGHARCRSSLTEGRGGSFRRSQITLVIREFIPGMKSSTGNRFIVREQTFSNKRIRITHFSNLRESYYVFFSVVFLVKLCLVVDRVNFLLVLFLFLFFLFFGNGE